MDKQMNKERSKTYIALNEKSLLFYKNYNNEFSYVNCPFCSNKTSKDCYEIDNYKVVQCNSCLSYFINPRPAPDLVDIYFKEYYQDPFCELRSNERETYDFKKRYIGQANSICGYIKSFLPEAKKLSILDIGCSCGYTLQCIKEVIKDVECELIGIDLHIPKTDNTTDVRLIETSIENYLQASDGQKFDVILVIGVLEAMFDCCVFMKCVKKMLTKNGLIYITTPNINSIPMILNPNKFYSIRAHSLNPPYGVNAFNPTNMTIFARKYGLKIEKLSTPGKLDLEILRKCKIGDNTANEKLINNFVNIISKCSDKESELLQKLINKLLISSHMEVILRNSG
jgi:2-polyprenyl-3-methyl-5-hydroxy-6-metoxy-1,4-benzoquinol methylase